MQQHSQKAIQLLKEIIRIPSFSRFENDVASHIASFFDNKQMEYERIGNNLLLKNNNFDPNKPTILLNSHIDTVKPSQNWESDPFMPIEKDGKIYGLGSNDAGASLVCLISVFLHFYEKPLPYNLLLATTAEEEVSGQNGVSLVIEKLPAIDLAIVGEPTGMNMAIAEKGLMVIDCYAKGKAGHAARNEGENAIYNALKDIAQIQSTLFDDESPLLGATKTTVTIIESGTQHNVVPDTCHFVIDVRTNEHYSNQKAFEIINTSLKSDCKARSYRLNSSSIPVTHPIVKRGIELGLNTFGSPTLSDQALLPFTSIKIGPGDSARSHTANEYIYVSEIETGVETYIQLLEGLVI